jgi:hypothetical protein
MLAAAPQVHSSASTPPGPHAGAAECEAQERSAECTRAAVAVLFAVASGAWDQAALVRNGFLAVDARKHCVNLDGTCTMKKLDSSLHRIQQHLRAHGSAASHYWLRLSKYTSTLRIQRPPTLSGKMMAKPGPRPLEFRRRIRATDVRR